jgi:moderate conductance mechanosensitive channel
VVGDIVRIGDVVGRVEHMTLRRTVIRDPQGAVVTIPNGEIGKVANLSRDWGQLFLDTTIAADQPLGNALDALETVTSEFRADAAWSPMLMDGPRVLGVESLSATGTTVRLQARTAPTRQDDVARELRRRIQMQLEQRGIRLAGVHRVEFVGGRLAKPSTEPDPGQGKGPN